MCVTTHSANLVSGVLGAGVGAPIGIAARHLSLCEAAWWIAFGNGTTYSPRRTAHPAALSATDSGKCEASRGMAAGLTNHIWRLEETLLLPLPAPDIPALPPAQEPIIRRKRSKSK